MMFRKEEDLIKNQTQERKALPKRIRQEMKAREMMFRESMRISVTNLNEILKPTEEKERIKKVINSRKFRLTICIEMPFLSCEKISDNSNFYVSVV